MPALPIISIKSKSLQEQLGVTTPRGAKKKLIRDFGLTLIKGEYISLTELDTILANELRKSSPLGEMSVGQRGSGGSGSWTSGSSFTDLKD